MTDIHKLVSENAARWPQMEVHPALVGMFDHIAAALVQPMAKARYQDVAGKTGVPWYIIAVIHEREASQSWTANLAQGDRWDRPSVHEPHTPAFASWENAAVYALKSCPPHAANWKDWSPGGALALLEEYNGLGYFQMGRPSPYVWAGTNQYVSGKYVSDHHFDAHAIDHQPGCAPLIARMMKLDGSIDFGRPTSVPVPVQSPTVTPVSLPPPPQTLFQKIWSKL